MLSVWKYLCKGQQSSVDDYSKNEWINRLNRKTDQDHLFTITGLFCCIECYFISIQIWIFELSILQISNIQYMMLSIHISTREKVRTWSIIKHWKKVIDHSNEGHEYLILIPINFALQLGPWLYFWEQWSRQHGGPGNVKYHQYAKIQRINETRDIFGGDNTFSLAQGSLYRLHQPVNMYTSWNIRLLPVLWAVRGEMVGLVG